MFRCGVRTVNINEVSFIFVFILISQWVPCSWWYGTSQNVLCIAEVSYDIHTCYIIDKGWVANQGKELIMNLSGLALWGIIMNFGEFSRTSEVLIPSTRIVVGLDEEAHDDTGWYRDASLAISALLIHSSSCLCRKWENCIGFMAFGSSGSIPEPRVDFVHFLDRILYSSIATIVEKKKKLFGVTNSGDWGQLEKTQRHRKAQCHQNWTEGWYLAKEERAPFVVGIQAILESSLLYGKW